MHVKKTKYSFPVSEIRLLMVVTLSCYTCLPVTPAAVEFAVVPSIVQPQLMPPENGEQVLLF